MSHEFEYLFFKYTARSKPSLNFNEWPDYGEIKSHKFQEHVKWSAIYNRPSGRVSEYSIQVFDFNSNTKKLLINYRADAVKFQPEQIKYYEPTWKDFTDEQLKKVIKYLSPLLEMKMETNRDHYNLLVFKDHFHLSIRTPHMDEFDELEHNICITVYDIDLESIKL